MTELRDDISKRDAYDEEVKECSDWLDSAETRLVSMTSTSTTMSSTIDSGVGTSVDIGDASLMDSSLVSETDSRLSMLTVCLLDVLVFLTLRRLLVLPTTM